MAEVNDSQLIRVAQLPVIEERLRSMKTEIENEINNALSLACTPETLTSVKKTRSELNKKFLKLEEQRKAVKEAIFAPYEQFSAVYKEFVADPLSKADRTLRDRAKEVEDAIKLDCENRLREYFAELIALEDLPWLQYERLEISVDLTSAKQKTPKKLMEQIKSRVTIIAADVVAIEQMPDAAEIMAEYKEALNMATAVFAVQERHAKVEREKKAAEEREAAKKRWAESISKVQSASPAPLPPQEVFSAQPKKENVYLCSFRVKATKEQLRKIKEFLTKEGIQFE